MQIFHENRNKMKSKQTNGSCNKENGGAGKIRVRVGARVSKQKQSETNCSR